MDDGIAMSKVTMVFWWYSDGILVVFVVVLVVFDGLWEITLGDS